MIIFLGFPLLNDANLIFDIFKNYKIVHFIFNKKYVGNIIKENKKNKKPLLNNFKNFHCITQLDVCIDKDNCYWPQIIDYEQLYNENKDSIFILNKRNPMKIYTFFKNWNNLLERFYKYNSCNSYDDFINYVNNHYNNIEFFFKNKSCKYYSINLDSYDIENLKKFLNTNKKKYYLSILAMFKNEETIMKSWIEHYLNEGVEHFYLIDNGSNDDYKKILKNYVGKYDLIKDDSRYPVKNYVGTQQILYNKYYLNKVKSETDWLLVCDLDEYLYNQHHEKITDYLNKNEYDVYKIKWIFFGSNLSKTPSNIPTSLCFRENFNNDNHFKSLFKTNNLIKLDLHHHHFKYNTKIYSLSYNDSLLLNHYQIISYDYFYNIRCKRGGGVHNTKDYKYTEKYLVNNEKFMKVNDERLKNKKLNHFTNIL